MMSGGVRVSSNTMGTFVDASIQYFDSRVVLVLLTLQLVAIGDSIGPFATKKKVLILVFKYGNYIRIGGYLFPGVSHMTYLTLCHDL